jgi:hypothetical protein
MRLAELGEHEQARALAEDTVARRRRVLGDDHPDTRRYVEFLQELDDQVGEGGSVELGGLCSRPLRCRPFPVISTTASCRPAPADLLAARASPPDITDW